MKRWLAIPLAAIVASVVGVASYGTPTTNAGTTPYTLSVDCDAGTAGIQASCVYPSGPVTVGVVFTNTTGAAVRIGTFDFKVEHAAAGLFDAPNNTNQLNGNPDFTAGSETDWACGPPNPDDDFDDNPANGERSFISCFNGSGTGPLVAGGASIQLAAVTYNVTGTGVEDFGMIEAGVADDTFTELMSCNPVVTNAGDCFPATIQIGASAATNTPTNTPAPATNTPVPTNTCVGAACPTSTSLAFVTVTPTPVPGTATPAGGAPTAPPAGGTPGAPPPPPPPGGTTGGGGQGTITLPDTGSGGDAGTALLGENTLLLAVALGAAAVLSGGMWLTATAAARGED